MENGLVMLGHSAILGFIAYLIMIYLLSQSAEIALDRSVLLGSFTLLYMVMFGHGAPSMDSINPKIWS
jgi:hypothetical protein